MPNRILGFELEQFMLEVLRKNSLYREAYYEKKFTVDSKLIRPDIFVERTRNKSWEKLIIEVKSLSALNDKSIDSMIAQVERYQELLKKQGIPVKTAVIVLGIATIEQREKFKDANVEIWDKLFVQRNFYEELVLLKNQFPTVSSYFLKDIDENYILGKKLIKELEFIKSGRKNWYLYQKKIENVLDFLFGKTLSSPLSETSDETKTNRRDFILRNYSDKPFWKYLRERYYADYIVVDAKNYTGKVKKNEILQLSNYLKIQGTGLFGLIITRKGEEKSSYITRREKWLLERKMILIINDDDLEEMILAQSVEGEPEEVIRRKIDEFRLKI